MSAEPAEIVGWDVEVVDDRMWMRLELKIPHLAGSTHQQAGGLSVENAEQLVWDLKTKIEAVKLFRTKNRRPPSV